MIDFSPITLDTLIFGFALLTAIVPVIGAWLYKIFKTLKLEERSFGLIKEKQFADRLTQATIEGVGYAEEWAYKKALDVSKVEVRNEMARMAARFALRQYPDIIKWFKEKQDFQDGDLIALIMSYIPTPINEKATLTTSDPLKEMYPSASDASDNAKEAGKELDKK